MVNMRKTYLRIEIVDLIDSGINIASMNGPPDLYARLNGLLLKRKLNVRFLCKFLRSPRISFADKVIHDDEVDVPAESTISTVCTVFL